MNRLRRSLLLVTDLGFLAYWALSFANVLPASWLYRDFAEPARPAAADHERA